MTGSRPDADEYFLSIAAKAAERSTCARRAVGCVLVDCYGDVLATGYNGVASGLPHCIDTPCPGAREKSGEGLHLCEAIHAEQNALVQCRSIREIHTVYTTSSPCIHCMRLLLGTSVKRIVFSEEYPHAESKRLAAGAGIEWVHRPPG